VTSPTKELDIGVKQFSFKAKVTIHGQEMLSTLSKKGHQFPIANNSATTGQ
jgi:hypothetical protein